MPGTVILIWISHPSPEESIYQYVSTKEIAKRGYEELVAQLSPEEAKIVGELLNTERSAVDALPDDIAADDLWRKLSATAKALSRIQAAVGKLKPFLGRMLVLLQRHPELHQNIGYDNFNDFMSKGCWEFFQVSRNEAFACKRVAEEIGNRLTPEEVSNIGFTKVALAATAIRKRTDVGMLPEARERVIKEWVEAARESTVIEIKEKMADYGIIEAGELEMETLVMNLRKDVRERYLAFRKASFVRAHAGGESDSLILDAMMMECSTWEASVAENEA